MKFNYSTALAESRLTHSSTISLEPPDPAICLNVQGLWWTLSSERLRSIAFTLPIASHNSLATLQIPIFQIAVGLLLFSEVDCRSTTWTSALLLYPCLDTE